MADATTATTPPGRLPLLRSFQGYQSAFVPPDLIAGLTLAAIAIPEQMATARLGGLAPQLGFYAFIAATGAFVIFGDSRRLSAGADSTITPIFAGALALLAASGSPHYGALAGGLALMVGIIVAGAGALRMGWIGNLLSIPVTTGFLAGIAIHIAVSQLPGALGLPAMSGPILRRIGQIVAAAPHANLASAGLAAGVLALIAAAHKISLRLPGALLAVGAAGLAVAVFHLEKVGVKLLGPIAGGLPTLTLPALGWTDWLHLVPLAVLVALVVMVQTAATAKAFPPEREAPDVDGDYIGLGLGNIAAGLIGAFPVNASPPRTAIVTESGGRSQLSGLTALAAIVLLLVAGMGVLRLIPEAALSAVLLFVALRIFRVADMVAIARSSPVEALLIAATAAGIVVLPIENGVALGIGLSLLQGIWGSARAGLRPMHNIPGTSVWWPTTKASAGETRPGVAVVTFQAPLTFLNADAFERQLKAAAGQGGVKLLVLEAAGITDIDFTAAAAFKAALAACRDAGVTLAIARLESVAAQHDLARLGLRALIGEDHVFESVAEAVATLAPDTPTTPAV